MNFQPISNLYHFSDQRSLNVQPQYMLMLSSVLVDESTPLHIRNAAGLALKNTLTARVRLLNYLLQPYVSVYQLTITGKHSASRVHKSLARSSW